MQVFVDALVDALKDTAIVLPLLYLTYLLVGYFSHNSSQKYSKILHHTKKAGPLVGAFLGCIPQCGFSSVMSNLYSHKIVTLGTLFAVFIATSDEAIPLMIAKPQFIPKLLIMLALKVAFAIIIGYGIDLLTRLFTIKKQKAALDKQAAELVEEEKSEGEDEHEHSHEHECTCEHNDHEFMAGGCNHEHVHSDCCAKNIFLDALKHTAIIIAYVFVATLAINLILGYFKLDAIQSVFPQNIFLQILIACAIGLIPNCAASIFLVEMYMGGIIAFAPLVAGLCAGAGVGLIVLFTSNKKHIWKNLLIVAGLFVAAYACGVITSFIPV